MSAVRIVQHPISGDHHALGYAAELRAAEMELSALVEDGYVIVGSVIAVGQRNVCQWTLIREDSLL